MAQCFQFMRSVCLHEPNSQRSREKRLPFSTCGQFSSGFAGELCVLFLLLSGRGRLSLFVLLGFGCRRVPLICVRTAAAGARTFVVRSLPVAGHDPP